MGNPKKCRGRQRWGRTINAARLAVAAPWIILALLSLRPEAVDAYNTPQGLAVLASAAASACSPTAS